jgi:hypothetical protein
MMMAKTATKTKTPPKPAEKPKPQTGQRSAAPAQANRKAPEPEPRRQQQQVGRQDVAKLKETGVTGASANLPAHMQNDVGMGKENIGQADMDIPRLKLIQGLSKELQLYDDLKTGNFFHTATEAIFDQPFRVVPIFMDKQYILWRPLENGGGILARAADGVHWAPSAGEFEVKLDRKDGGNKVKWKLQPTVQQSGLANWGTMNPENNNSPPAATLMYNFLLAFPDEPDQLPAVLTFQRSSIKIGRKFMTKLKTVRTPLFGSVFTLSSFIDHNSAQQDFQNINIVGAGLVEDPELYQMYKDLHLSLADKGLNIRDIDSLQGDPEASGSDDAEIPGN